MTEIVSFLQAAWHDRSLADLPHRALFLHIDKRGRESPLAAVVTIVHMPGFLDYIKHWSTMLLWPCCGPGKPLEAIFLRSLFSSY